MDSPPDSRALRDPTWRQRADRGPAPDPPIAGVGIGGSLATLVIWIVGEAGVTMPPEVAAAATLVVCTLIGWLSPRRWVNEQEAARELVQRALRGSGGTRRKVAASEVERWPQGGRRAAGRPPPAADQPLADDWWKNL